MTQNNNFSVLPFYTSLDEQDCRKSYAYGDIYPLIAPANKILPFQIMRETRSNDISRVNLYDKRGQFVADLTQNIKEAGMQITKFADFGYDVIVYPANLPMEISQKDGIYYMEISDGIDTWYSEMFTAVNNVSGYVKVEWYDIEDFVFDAGRIVYKNPEFHNILYLCTQVGKPDYEFEEEGESRDGYFFAEKRVSSKTYKCTITAPEYLCDVMRFIRMADYARVTDTYGRIYDCDTFLITPEWQDQGNIASVEVEFTTDTAAKKIALGYSSKGDFNSDYNKDYDVANG
jgi:hypothetical protein